MLPRECPGLLIGRARKQFYADTQKVFWKAILKPMPKFGGEEKTLSAHLANKILPESIKLNRHWHEKAFRLLIGQASKQFYAQNLASAMLERYFSVLYLCLFVFLYLCLSQKIEQG